MIDINPQELHFIEDLGLLIEKSGGSRTLGRVFGYLLLADSPKTMDEIAAELIFSKATASLTIRQGLITRFFEKVSIPGERKTYYRANSQSWINSMSDKVSDIIAWKRLIEHGLSVVAPEKQTVLENLEDLKDYFEFLRWYSSDLAEQYECWKKDRINKS